MISDAQGEEKLNTEIAEDGTSSEDEIGVDAADELFTKALKNQALTSESDVKTLPLASIIIVNTNELHHLKRLLPSIFAQNYSNYEVFVIDNDSSDGSMEYVHEAFPDAQIIRNDKNLGYTGANNVGFDHVTGEYIAILNPDTEVHPDWLRELVRTMEADPSIGLATPKIKIMDRLDVLNTCGNDITFTGITVCRGLEESTDLYENEEMVSAVSGAAFVIKRPVLDHIGGFDESYFLYYEDTDLSLRAMIAGYKIVYVPTSIVHHNYAFRFSPEKGFYQERNRYFSLLKVLRRRTLLVMLPALLLGEILAWGYAFLLGTDHLKSKWQGYVWIVRNRHIIQAARERVQVLRVVDDRTIVHQFSHTINFAQTTNPVFARILHYVVNPILRLLGKIIKTLVHW